MYAAIVYYLHLIYCQVLFFKLSYLEQVSSKYSEWLYLCLNNYLCKVNSKFNQLLHRLNIIECTLGCQYVSVTLYLLQTYPSGKPLFKGINMSKYKPLSSSSYIKLVKELNHSRRRLINIENSDDNSHGNWRRHWAMLS